MIAALTSAMACDPFTSSVPAFRRADADDARAIATLQDMANEGQMRAIWSRDGRDWREIGAAEIASNATEMGVASTIVATLGGEVVGFLNFATNNVPPQVDDPLGAPFAALRRALGPCLYLRAMAVGPGHRGRGIAARLLDIAEGAAAALGERALGVIVHEDNRALLDHYRRRGFEGIARKRVREHVAYPVGSELVALRKPLRTSG